MFLRLCSFLLAALLLVGCGQSSSNGSSSQARAIPTEPALSPPLPGVYAALGASETYGVGAIPHTRGYAYLVAKKLHVRSFVDTGIPGTTINSGYQSELTTALNARPSLCTVFFGVNDFRAGVGRAAFLSDLHDLVASLRQAKAQVVIIGVPDVSLLPAVRRQHISGVHQIVTSWNAGMRTVARQTGARFLNLDAFAADLATHPGYIAQDGLHPSTAGHARLAQIVVKAIKQWRLWRVQ